MTSNPATSNPARNLAAIDCGTHSTRLLICQTDGNEPAEAFKTLVRQTNITGLGEGLSETGVLSDVAIQRTLQSLANYSQLMKEHSVEGFRIVATSACRDASNADSFFNQVNDILGKPPELLSGEQEAELAFRGATLGLSPEDGPFLVCDIGGGSTEFAFGGGFFGDGSLDGGSTQHVFSADIGSTRMSEQFIHSDPPLPEELSACLQVIQLHLDDLLSHIPAATQAKQLVGLAGTVTTAAAVEIGLQDYDPSLVHHFRLSKEAAEDVFRTLATENREQRLSNPGLHPQRVDVIVGGLCILVKIMRHLDFEDCLVSETDLLDGIILNIPSK